MPVRDLSGRAKTIEIRVPRKDGGLVVAWLDSNGVRLEPDAVSELIAAYREAQAQALLDRGRW